MPHFRSGDRGVQYLAIRYTERLADEGAATSVGSKGDSYDNALAETVNGLYKTELIRAKGPWRTADQVELTTAAWVAWWNEERLHEACGYLPPAEFEEAYHQRQSPDSTELRAPQCLHGTHYGSLPGYRVSQLAISVRTADGGRGTAPHSRSTYEDAKRLLG